MRSPELPRRPRWGLATAGAFALSGLLIGTVLVSGNDAERQLKRVDLAEDILRCADDAECVLVDQIGCCACQDGGGRWAINEGRRDDLRRFLKRICDAGTACIQVDACGRNLRAVCVEGRCAAKSHG